MAWQFPVSTSTSSTFAVNLVSTESAFVAKGVLVASTGNDAIHGTGSDHQVVIAGTAAAYGFYAVHLGDSALNDHDNSITVEAPGEIRSFGGFAIVLEGYQAQVTNAGLVYGGAGGIYLTGTSAGTVSTIVNDGVITSGVIGIARFASTETVVFTNSGNAFGSDRIWQLFGPRLDGARPGHQYWPHIRNDRSRRRQ